MIIVQSIKKRKHDIVITFDNDETLTVLYDIYVKYHIHPSLSMSEQTFKEMQEENAFLFFKRLALKRLARMMTAYELYTYLIDKGASQAMSNQIVADFKQKKYVNDEAYTAWYIDTKKYIEGPKRMRDKLLKKGVDQALIDQYLKTIDEYACVNYSIKKRLKGTNNQNKKQLTIKLKRYFMQKGFHLEVVNTCVNDIVSQLDIDEMTLIKKDIDKMMRKAKQPLDKYQLIEKLYRKGYRYSDIKQIVEEMNI